MLTQTQNNTLAAYIAADPVLGLIAHDASGAWKVAEALNAVAAPEFIVWRTSVTQDEIMMNGFDWTRVNNLSVGSARCWEWLFANEMKSINPSKINIRAGIDEVWKGTAADLAVRAAVYVHCKRLATIAEKVLSTGDGTTVSPATMTFDGSLRYHDIMAAWNWQ